MLPWRPLDSPTGGLEAPFRASHMITTDLPPLAAVIVVRNPQIDRLLLVVKEMVATVQIVVVIDNGSCPVTADTLALESEANERLLVVSHRNIGIASAQNEAIDLCASRRIDYVLFLDQDTAMTGRAVVELLHWLREMEHEGEAVAAVGPTLAGTPRTLVSEYRQEPFLASSGSIVPLSVLRSVGMFRDEYFIDHVDKEWGLRARAAGYKSYRAPGIEIPHDFGDGGRVWAGKPRRYHDAPVRAYYLVRNEILSWRDLHVSLGQRVLSALTLAKWCIVTLAVTNARGARAKEMWTGACHAVSHRAGERGSTEAAHAPVRFPLEMDVKL